MTRPPGHQPGVHIPGALVPIGAVVAQQHQVEQLCLEMQYDAAQRKRRHHDLLLLRL